MRGHLVALLLLSVWHSFECLKCGYNICLFFFREVCGRDYSPFISSTKALAGLKLGRSWAAMVMVLTDVAGRLGGAVLDDEAAEATQVHVLLLFEHALLHGFHEALYYDGHLFLLQAGLLSNLTDDICFRHS